MDHQAVQSLLSAYIDKELQEEERVQVEKHLAGCSECRKEKQVLRRISSGVVSAAEYTLPSDFTARVVRSSRQEKERMVSSKAVEQLSRRLVLGFSVAVIAFVTIGSLLQPAPPIVMETYLAGEPGDSLAARTLMTEGQLSKDELLLSAVIR